MTLLRCIKFFCLTSVQLVSCTCLLVLTSCGAPIPPTSGTVPSSVKTVAIISLLPDTISLSHVGITVFGNAFAVEPAEFDPNDVVIATATKALSPRYTVLTPTVDRSAIMADIKTAKPNGWLPGLPYVITDQLVLADIKPFIKPGDADLIVVFDGTEPFSTPRAKTQ